MWSTLNAVGIRATDLDTTTILQLNSTTAFFGAVNGVFLPAVVLYLLHLRGNVLRGMKGNTVAPIASRFWKRILDWSWVILTFIFYMAQLGYRESWTNKMLGSIITQDIFQQYLNITYGLAHTVTALYFLLCLNVFVSLVVHFVQSKNAQAGNPVTTRLLILAAPFFMIRAIEAVVIDIILSVATLTTSSNDALVIAEIIIQGTCEIMILIALLSTMILPNVQWAAQKAEVSIMEHGGTPMQQQHQHQQ